HCALKCKIHVAKQGYFAQGEASKFSNRRAILIEARLFCARVTSERNEVSQHEEVRGWIPDGRSYMDVIQHCS
ncbi:hypothetical protein, partial [Pseudoalteromonas phenolica]|uniref:hypothetical protein n=1 Tax=Pseudoalteromonas phenolica TaxID=161398 RepID=UPI00102737F5